MGRFSNLLKFLRIESLTEFEGELQKLRFITSSQIIAIVGIGSRFKGLPLIYVTDNENQLKVYSARIVQVLEHLTYFRSEKPVKELIVYYDDYAVIFRRLSEDVGFLGLTRFESDAEVMRQWILKKESMLKKILGKPKEETG
ncbi:MAG: hypothetical protein ACFFAS_04755 [Promethearchaeota archaeon]